MREKQLGDADFLQEAIQIHALCQQYGVPLFINEGEKIQIDTRTGEYLGRSKA